MMGTDEVLRVMMGTEEVTSLFMGSEEIPSGVTPEPVIDYSTMPFTIEILSGSESFNDGKLLLKPSSSSLSRGLKYSINGGEQTTISFGGDSATRRISVNEGDIIEFVAPNNQNGLADGGASFVSFDASGGAYFKVYGNIMSLSYVDFLSASAMPSIYCYTKLFKDSSFIKDAENLVVPDVTLTADCLEYAFQGATNLETAPQLKPSRLENACYGWMFRNCQNLTFIKCLADSNLSASYATANWVDGVSSTGTFVKKSGATLQSGANGIPNGWTVEEV